MGEMLKELGKLFYNFALLFLGAVIIQPWLKGVYSIKTLMAGFSGLLSFIFLGSILIVLGDKLENEED